MAENSAGRGRRVIQVNKHVVGPSEPRLRTVRLRKPADYPHVPAVYLQVAQKLSSPLLVGPPLCDELIALVCHLFSEEEAGVVRHLGGFSDNSAAELARAERRPLEEIQPILDQLALGKRLITSSGPAGKEQYRLLPLLPGMFEMALIGESADALSDWHRRLAELFEALYETGYNADYAHRPTSMVRYLPVGAAIDAHPMALPSDRLETVLDRFETFGIGQCQCRMTMQVVGQGCGKPLGNCTVMGKWAEQGIERGWLRQVTKKNVLEIKREAEAQGMVSWMMNVESTTGQCSCSCCGCCCKAMRTINEFNAPGLIAPPHFLPRLDRSLCSSCGKCATKCPMGAIIVDTQGQTYRHLRERCIGCGLCKLACEGQRAITMEPVADYRPPYRSWFSLLAHTAPAALKNAWNVWRKYR